MNDDSAKLLSEVTRILTVEAALRSAQHASRVGNDTVDVENVEKSVMQLVSTSYIRFKTDFHIFYYWVDLFPLYKELKFPQGEEGVIIFKDFLCAPFTQNVGAM